MTVVTPIPAFLKAFQDRRQEALEPYLHEETVYTVEGFAPLVGRRTVLAYWRRMFESHDTVRMAVERQVRDGNIVIAAQRQLYMAARRPPLLLDSLVIYELQDELIRGWSDRLDPAALPDEAAAVWRRLREARW